MTALLHVSVLALSLRSSRKQVAAQEESVQLKRLSGTFVHIPGENSEEPVAKGLDRGPQLVEQRLTAIEWHQGKLRLDRDHVAEHFVRACKYPVFISLGIDLEQESLSIPDEFAGNLIQPP